MFNVPSRLIELIEMPLKSFAVTAMPQFAKLNADKSFDSLRYEFEKKAGLVFFLLLPIAVGCFVFADWLVIVFGGKGYAEASILLRIFATYMVILTLDKFAGVLLDTVNKPNLNFYKVMIQLAVNVIGDYFAITMFGTLESVALVSTGTFFAGMIFGYYQLHVQMGIRMQNVMRYGLQEMKLRSLRVINK